MILHPLILCFPELATYLSISLSIYIYARIYIYYLSIYLSVYLLLSHKLSITQCEQWFKNVVKSLIFVFKYNL